MLTPDILARCMPRASREACETWAGPIWGAAVEFGISDQPRLATMLASIANETGQLSRFEEMSYFSTPLERIAYVFGTRTPSLEIMQGWKAQGKNAFDVAFFDHFYGSRMGNAGRGYKYRGLGPGQITGFDNCAQIGPMIGVDLVANPEAMLEPQTGARAFAAYLKVNRITDMSADGSEAGFFRAMKAMNSGLPDNEFQVHHLQRWREVMRGLTAPASKPAPETKTEAVKQAVTGKTGVANVIAGAASAITIAEAVAKAGEVRGAVNAGKSLFADLGIPAPWPEVILISVIVLCLGFNVARYAVKLWRGEAVST